MTITTTRFVANMTVAEFARIGVTFREVNTEGPRGLRIECRADNAWQFSAPTLELALRQATMLCEDAT